jgi:uroporphyrinogen-III synthase
MPDSRPLEGFTVGVTADRRATEQGQLLERRGATVVYGPTIVTEYLGDDDALHSATIELLDEPPDVVVANTAIGMRAWIESASAWGLDGALLAMLTEATLAARGPKAASACVAAGLRVDLQAEAERLDDVVRVLVERDLVAGKRIAVQLHGSGAEHFVEALQGAGAAVVPVGVYRYRMPDDDQPARRLIEAACDGRLQAITFTSRPAVDHLFAIADDAGLRDVLTDAFDGGVVVAACIGPVCAEAAERAGILAPARPDTGRMGLMIRALGAELATRRRTLEVEGVEVVQQGTVVRVGGRPVSLSARESELLAALLDRPGAVVARPALLARVWGTVDGDDHVLDVTVARLRRRLGPLGLRIVAVPRRGYRVGATHTHDAAV